MEKLFGKLVRDNIPEIILKNGSTPVIRSLSDDEYFCHLKKKLLEECNEVVNSKSNSETIEELSDVLEVVYSISKFLSISKPQLEDLRKIKSSKRGSFDNKILLEKVIY